MRTAHCIDLDALAGRQDLWRLRLRFDPRADELSVVRGQGRLLLVDLRTFAVSGGGTRGAGIVSSWVARSLAALAGCCALGALALLWFRRRRRRPLRPVLTPQGP